MSSATASRRAFSSRTNSSSSASKSISSGTPLLFIETDDEKQVEDLFRRIATRTGKPTKRWSVATGLQPLDNSHEAVQSLREPDKVLAAVAHRTEA